MAYIVMAYIVMAVDSGCRCWLRAGGAVTWIRLATAQQVLCLATAQRVLCLATVQQVLCLATAQQVLCLATVQQVPSLHRFLWPHHSDFCAVPRHPRISGIDPQPVAGSLPCMAGSDHHGRQACRRHLYRRSQATLCWLHLAAVLATCSTRISTSSAS